MGRILQPRLFYFRVTLYGSRPQSRFCGLDRSNSVASGFLLSCWCVGTSKRPDERNDMAKHTRKLTQAAVGMQRYLAADAGDGVAELEVCLQLLDEVLEAVSIQRVLGLVLCISLHRQKLGRLVSVSVGWSEPYRANAVTL